MDPSPTKRVARHSSTVSAVRRLAAAPPLYLLALCIAPFFAAVFIATTRWFNFRHHGFDILSGFAIGTICAFFAFRFYHLPISQGAGWAWGPRSHDKAFWAGVGSLGYATEKRQYVTGAADDVDDIDEGGHVGDHYHRQDPLARAGDEEEALGALGARDGLVVVGGGGHAPDESARGRTREGGGSGLSV